MASFALGQGVARQEVIAVARDRTADDAQPPGDTAALRFRRAFPEEPIEVESPRP